MRLKLYMLVLFLSANAAAPGPAWAQSSSSQATSDAVEFIASKLERAMTERAEAYARWQAANPVSPASGATFSTGLPTWGTYSGLNWTTSGTAETAVLCLTLAVPDGVTRAAVVRAAARQGAELVGASCQPISGQAALQAQTLGLRRELSRASVYVRPYSAPPGLLSGGGRLSVSRSSASTVTLTNTGPTDLPVDGISVSSPFQLTHNCVSLLAPSSSCSMSVTFVGQGRATAIGRLEVSVGGGSRFVIPLRSSLGSTPGSRSLSARN